MAKTYRALVEFRCPADPESLKKRTSALKMDEGEKKDALLAEVKWMAVKKGEKVAPYNEAIEKSWLSGDLVEEVKS